MRSFYGQPVHEGAGSSAPSIQSSAPATAPSITTSRARIAIYEAPGAAPRIEEIEPTTTGEYIEHLASAVHRLAREQGGDIPYTVVREVTENFIHAHFAEPVVSILDQGMTVRFADQGPGIPDKDNAVLPGFTTAAGEMKHYIRGVGSGLPLVRDYLSLSGGTLVIEDNLGVGSVVTIHSRASVIPQASVRESSPSQYGEAPYMPERPAPHQQSLSAGGDETLLRLPTRQQQVLALVMETGLVGPSVVAKELGVGVSTAYRDLASLEDACLIESDGGKRTLTEAGLRYINEFMAR